MFPHQATGRRTLLPHRSKLCKSHWSNQWLTLDSELFFTKKARQSLMPYLRVLPALVLLVAAVGLNGSRVAAQELEPRAYSVAPVGTNIAVVALGRLAGDLSFDPTLLVEDAEAAINAVTIGYFRSVSFLGRSASLSVAVPYMSGRVQGRLAGEFQSLTRSGLPDSRVRFAVNLIGAPAMDLEAFTQYRQRTNLGASVVVVAPTGQYDSSKVINLGSNRWAFKPELGLSHAFGRWTLDVYAGAWLFSANDDFLGRTREQDPLASTQVHLIYTVRRGLWVAFDANFFAGGRTTIDGVSNLDLQRNSRIGATVSVPLRRRHSVNVAFGTGLTATVGADFNAVAIAYQYLWGGGL